MNGADIDGQGSADARQKAKRRSKNNGDDRNFTCGCGKSYLSYPALYTHIKTKHEGVPPPGTSQHQANGKSGRGRPKKEDSSAKHKEEEPEEESVDLSDTLENLINFLTDLSVKIQYEGQETDEVQKSLVAKDSEVDVINDFPQDIFKGREDEYIPVLENLKLTQSAKYTNDETVDPQTDLKLTPVNKILAHFIFEVAPHLRKLFYREFVFFLLMYRRALNQFGWDTKLKLTGQGQENEAKEFCETSVGEYIPEICNDFITELLPEYLKEYDLKGFKVIGAEVPQLRNAVFLTQYLCNWLNLQKYTNARLVLNPEDN